MLSRWTLLLPAVLALLLLGCGAKGSPAKSAPQPSPSATRVARAPSPTPDATFEGPPGRVQTAVQAQCRLSDIGAEITATYRAHAFGNAGLRRVSLLINNRPADDSGAIYDIDFQRTTVIRVTPGEHYQLEVAVMAPNSIPPQQILSIVFCPRSLGTAA